ncbi:MAG: hypothetical protein EA343_08990 [Nodularia sp. (in: Bacteria)]|nr:MAG: hypothetical protein EA343_08990 [Nodularia sp. (in: cyanobacteria)]
MFYKIPGFLRYVIAISVLLHISSFFYIQKSVAQEQVFLDSAEVLLDYKEISDYSCRNAIEKTKNKLKSKNIKFYPLKQKISDLYKNTPDGKIISFLLWSDDNNHSVKSFTNSPQLMLILSRDIINNCQSYQAYAVEFKQYHSGYSEMFGLINGVVQQFETIEDAHDGKWGINYITYTFRQSIPVKIANTLKGVKITYLKTFCTILKPSRYCQAWVDTVIKNITNIPQRYLVIKVNLYDERGNKLTEQPCFSGFELVDIGKTILPNETVNLKTYYKYHKQYNKVQITNVTWYGLKEPNVNQVYPELKNSCP